MDTFVAEILLPGTLRAAAGLLLTAVAAFAARGASATQRHRLWSLGLLAALVLPVIGPLTPVVARLPLAPGKPAQPVAALSITTPVVPTAAAAPAVTPEVATVAVAEPGFRVTPAQALGALWAAGFLVVVAGRLGGLAARRRLRRGARELADPGWQELCRELARELGVHRPLTLLLAPDAGVPMTWGTLAPVIVLPAAALAWPPDRRRAVLLHELAHVRRADAAFAALAHLACACHWPNPLVWLAARRQRAEAEHAADDRVLTRGERPSLYAGHLLAVARALTHAAPPPRPVLAMAQPEGSSSLARRIGAILDGTRPRSEGRGWVRAGAAALAFVVTWVLAATGCVQVDGLQYSMTSSEAASGPDRGYFSGERFAGQCPPGLMSGQGRSIHVHGYRWGGLEIQLANRSCSLEIEIAGQVQLDEETLGHLAQDGKFSAVEKSGRGTRSLLATPGAGGAPQVTYTVDGTVKPLDDEGRAFLARVILEVHRSSTAGAEERVARLLARGGAAAVLAEVEQISADFLRAHYLKLFLEQGHPRGEDLAKVLAATAQLVDSDYEQSQILEAVAENAPAGEPLPPEFFTAAAAIESDYERSQALQRALARSRPSEEEIARVLEVARDLDSDYERSQVLQHALAESTLPANTALEVVRSAAALGSDYETGQVLGQLIAKRPLSTAEVEAVIAAATEVGSDYERAELLIALVHANPLTGVTLDHFVAAAEALGSDYDRDRTLAAAMRSRKG